MSTKHEEVAAEQNQTSDDKVRVSFTVSQPLLTKMREIGKEDHLSDADILRYLIALGTAIHEEKQKGRELAMTDKDGTTVAVRFLNTL